jgi:hypothetical protein
MRDEQDESPYDEALAAASLRKLRNRIARFHPSSLLRPVIRELNHPDALDPARWVNFATPWTLLALAERILLAQRGLPAPNSEQASERDFLDVLQRLRQFENDHTVLPRHYDSIWSFARVLGFRQQWLQERFHAATLARQELVLLKDGRTSIVDDQLRNICGLSLAEFLDAASTLSGRFLRSENSATLSEADINTYERVLPSVPVRAYLRAMSLDLAQASTYLADVYRLGTSEEAPSEEQVLGQSPLWRYPFLRFDGAHHLLGRPLFWAHTREYVTEVLRAADPQEFGRKFGPPFERYLELALRDSRVTYRDESWLARHLPGDGKVADYVILVEDTAIIVDAKAFILPAPKRGVLSRRSVTSALKNNVVYSVTQALETAARLRAAGIVDGIDFRSVEFFSMCVTPRELYLAVGQDFIDNYAADAYSRGAPAIPKANFFALSAHAWENTFAAVAAGGALAPALRARAQANTTQKTLLFTQGLFEAENERGVPTPSYLKDGPMTRLKRILESAQR